ncbi:hypothetical protein C8T65DRAFT_643784 [Cerioporus squamosus]|nr:hypothetical protein C8T65DRAFT_643784 [Cerioporus squamosus]
MNRTAAVDAQFAARRIAVQRLQGQAMPRSTPDHTETRSFSRPFTLDEVEAAKSHIRNNCSGRACGLGDVFTGADREPPRALTGLAHGARGCCEEAAEGWLRPEELPSDRPRKRVPQDAYAAH